MIERAFRAHTNDPWARVAEDDVMRVIEDRVIAFANAYPDGWSTFWPIGSRLALDLFVERWLQTRDLEASFAHVRMEFPERCKVLPGHAGDDELAGDPGVSLLVASIEPAHVDVVWIGTQHLVVVRDGVVVSRTEPDTLVEMGRAQGFDMTDSPHRHVITRTIRAGDILAPHVARFVHREGDRVIVASESVDGAIAETARDVLEKLPRDKFECAVVVT